MSLCSPSVKRPTIGSVPLSLYRPTRLTLGERSDNHRETYFLTRVQNMDKKSKKRLDVINKKLTTLRPRLAGSREQADDPQELKELEDEVASLEAEAKKLKES